MDNAAHPVTPPTRRMGNRIIWITTLMLAFGLAVQTWRAWPAPIRYHRHSGDPSDAAASSLAEARLVLQGASAASASFFTLDPEDLGFGGRLTNFRYLKDWKILSEKTLDATATADVLALLTREGTYYDGGALCFDPGLGFRFRRGDSSVELVICLDCSWVYAWTQDEHFRWSLSPKGKQEFLKIYRSQVTSDAKLTR